MNHLDVELGQRSYPIYVENGLFDATFKSHLASAGQVAIITNQTVSDLYLDKVIRSFSQSKVKVLIAPDSEQAKSIDVYSELMTQLLEANFNRSSLLVALGGGVIGDLTGFLAATLHRGCRLIQIPTTLLSQVDSSVGGKTAINHPAGKNLIGAFYQPESVFIDPATLTSLPSREFSAGMAEVIKYGFVSGNDFFNWLYQNRHAIKEHDPVILEQMILQCCSFKAKVVAEDERERGQRALLNYGHTFGHAIEQVAGYGEWLHGEAVAVGMLMAMQLAIDAQLCDSELYPQLEELIDFFALPTVVSNGLPVDRLIAAMMKDKKNEEQTLRLILPVGIGQSVIQTWHDIGSIESLWGRFGAMA